jgi:hypothetical protein
MLITVLKTAEFGGFAPNSATAVLRIYDPTDDWAEDAALQGAAGWAAFLPLAFWDMGSADLGLGGRLLVRLLGRWPHLFTELARRFYGEDIPWRPFLAADAAHIAAFADGLDPALVTQLLVVCRHGRGRSGTIGRWLARRLGATIAAGSGEHRESDAIRRTLDRLAGPSPARR